MFNLGPQRLINRTDKYVVVNNVGPKKWRHLARHMNLTELEIDCIDYEYDKYGLHEKVLHMSLHHNCNHIFYQVALVWRQRRDVLVFAPYWTHLFIT